MTASPFAGVKPGPVFRVPTRALRNKNAPKTMTNARTAKPAPRPTPRYRAAEPAAVEVLEEAICGDDVDAASGLPGLVVWPWSTRRWSCATRAVVVTSSGGWFVVVTKARVVVAGGEVGTHRLPLAEVVAGLDAVVVAAYVSSIAAVPVVDIRLVCGTSAGLVVVGGVGVVVVVGTIVVVTVVAAAAVVVVFDEVDVVVSAGVVVVVTGGKHWQVEGLHT